jgi:hypothetical protein
MTCFFIRLQPPSIGLVKQCDEKIASYSAIKAAKKRNRKAWATATLGQLDMSLWVPFPLSMTGCSPTTYPSLKKGKLFLTELNHVAKW